MTELDATVAAALRPALIGYVGSRVRNPEAAEDIVQDVLLKASRTIHSLRSPQALPGWLFQIARRAVADHFRMARGSEMFDETLHAPEPESGPPDAGRLEERLAAYIRSVVENLPPLYRDALLATEYQGLSQADLARRDGVSLSAAKSRVQRARAMMRAEMERCCRWESDRYGHILDVIPRDGGCSEK